MLAQNLAYESSSESSSDNSLQAESSSKNVDSYTDEPVVHQLQTQLSESLSSINEISTSPTKHQACRYSTDKPWLDRQYHNAEKTSIKKPNELENEMQDPPHTYDENILDRIHGSIIGMAIGDALGAHVEFRPREYLLEHPVKELVGGGTWGLEKGQFTDDTSMALCLANSLIARHRFVPYDQLVRYKWWHENGYMSSTGECFDIGAATRTSVDEFVRRQKEFAQNNNIPLEQLDCLSDSDLLSKFDTFCSVDGVAGNGALMRLAPVPLFFCNYPTEAVEYSGISGMITHGDRKSYDACRYYGALIVAAVRGELKDQLLDKNFYENHKGWFSEKPLHEDIMKIVQGSYQKPGGYEDGIRGKGYIVEALEAALWAFWSDGDSFKAGVLAAVNLGDDTDTTAAIYGQLAGAYYGYQSLPSEWAEQIYAKKFIATVSKWIAYEGQNWAPEQIEKPIRTLSQEEDSSSISDHLEKNSDSLQTTASIEQNLIPSLVITPAAEEERSSTTTSQVEEEDQEQASLSTASEIVGKPIVVAAVTHDFEEHISPPATPVEEKQIVSPAIIAVEQQDMSLTGTLLDVEEDLSLATTSQFEEEDQASLPATPRIEERPLCPPTTPAIIEEPIVVSTATHDLEEHISSPSSPEKENQLVSPPILAVEKQETTLIDLEEDVSLSTASRSKQVQISSSATSRIEEQRISPPTTPLIEEKLIASSMTVHDTEEDISLSTTSHIEEEQISQPATPRTGNIDISSPIAPPTEEKLISSFMTPSASQENLLETTTLLAEEKVISSPIITRAEEKKIPASTSLTQEAKLYSQTTHVVPEQQIFPQNFPFVQEKVINSPTIVPPEPIPVSITYPIRAQEVRTFSPTTKRAEQNKNFSASSQFNRQYPYDSGTIITTQTFKRNKNMAAWTVNDVYEWIRSLDESFGSYANIFRNDRVDGYRVFMFVNSYVLYKYGITNEMHQQKILDSIQHFKNIHVKSFGHFTLL